MRKNKNQSGPNFLSFLEKGIGLLVEKLFSKSSFAVLPHGELSGRWQEIERMDPKLAVIEADKLVDTVLRRAGLDGASMADRIRKTEKMVSRPVYQSMWDAHKVRNELVHEVDRHVNEYSSRDAINKMKNYLEALGAFKND
jgi:hypothetical protein